uniref:Uncharacterized protein n=1 Tax=Seriola dumerili TaxID=41447 RepID=A0A3B4VJM5_SERDU
MLMSLHVWHTPRERFRAECLTPKVGGSAGSVMLWGAFCCHVLAPLAITWCSCEKENIKPSPKRLSEDLMNRRRKHCQIPK